MKKFLLTFLLIATFSNATISFASFGTKAETETSANPNSVNSTPGIAETKKALEEFKKLGKKAKRERFKEVTQTLKKFKADKKAGEDISTNTLLLVLLAILVPPLAVYLHEGETNNVFWINVLLTVLGYVLLSFTPVIFLGSLPGIIHALIVILS